MKKTILIIFLVTCSFLLSATNYYVSSSSGNDSNNGLTESTAWKTISKVNSKTFLPSDVILFKKGDTWREMLLVTSSGTSSSFITYSTYGTGNNPRITGSGHSEFVSSGVNLWKSINTYSLSSLNGIFFETSSGTVWGVLKSTLTAQYQWNTSGGYLYVYSTTMPEVEIQLRDFVIDLNNKQYIRFNGIDVLYGKWSGYGFDVGSFNQIELFGLIIENCEIGFIGSPTSYNGSDDIGYGTELAYTNMVIRNCRVHDCGRRGISLHIYGNGFTVRNMLIEKCHFYNGFHTTGIDISVGSGYSASVDGLIIRQNLTEGNSSNDYTTQLFIQNYVSSASLKNIFIYSNIFRNGNSYDILAEGVKGVVYIYNNDFIGTPTHISVQNNGQNSNAVIKNNIFTSGQGVETYGGQNIALVTIDKNLFYNASGLKGTNSITANPLFVSTSDYHLQAGSPAIGTGLYIPEVLTDYEGNLFGNPRNIGAYANLSTDINDNKDSNIKIYPTVVGNKITIEGNVRRVQIIDYYGRILIDENINFTKNTIYLNLKPGLYFIKTDNIVSKFIVY